MTMDGSCWVDIFKCNNQMYILYVTEIGLIKSSTGIGNMFLVMKNHAVQQTNLVE
jgi:hypothetical protein